MNRVIIEMPLIKDLSVNHYRGRRRDGGEYVKKSVSDWKETMGWLLKPYHLEDWKLPLTVKCDIVQADKRTRDISNFSKVVLDAIEDLTGINDTNYRWHDGHSKIDSTREPILLITIESEVSYEKITLFVL